MTIYIALLRGINVGGNHKIKMIELKSMLEEMGLSRVQTYIQSGNVLLESAEQEGILQTKLEDEIKRVFGFPVAVMLRTSEELKRIIKDCPFPADSLLAGESIHVNFMKEPPLQKEIDRLPDVSNEIDTFRILGREIYLFFRQRMSDSKLPNKLQKLGLPTTSRNWNTVTKLAEMAKAMEDLPT
jgi:uncharacterized protein (DUF1697 family)